MDDLQQYFGGAVKPKKRKKLPECTDSTGEPLKRLGPVVIRRVLDDPGNLTGDSDNSYALVYCEALGIGIHRDGARIRSAKFYLFSLEGHDAAYTGAEGRDKAIDRFLRMLRKGKRYGHVKCQCGRCSESGQAPKDSEA